MNKPLVSPIINDDHSVTFNFRNEGAKRVEINGDFRLGRQEVGANALDNEHVPMDKSPIGFWTITTEPLQPGIYRYHFIVDGIRTFDPLNPLLRFSPGLYSAKAFNLFEIKGNENMPWDLIPDISHGTVVIEKFYSEVLKRSVGCTVYLPPSYPSVEKRYPVLYLLHGGGGNFSSWICDGNANRIMDFLVSNGTSDEIIVVMPECEVRNSDEERRNERPNVFRDRHANYFVNDLIPFIETRYHVQGEKRAVAGLSIGGSQTFNLVASHPEMFMACGIFSVGGVVDALPRIAEKLKRLKIVFVSKGTYEGTKPSTSQLEKMGVPCNYAEYIGGHIWCVWQRSLVDFVICLAKHM